MMNLLSNVVSGLAIAGITAFVSYNFERYFACVFADYYENAVVLCVLIAVIGVCAGWILRSVVLKAVSVARRRGMSVDEADEARNALKELRAVLSPMTAKGRVDAIFYDGNVPTGPETVDALYKIENTLLHHSKLNGFLAKNEAFLSCRVRIYAYVLNNTLRKISEWGLENKYDDVEYCYRSSFISRKMLDMIRGLDTVAVMELNSGPKKYSKTRGATWRFWSAWYGLKASRVIKSHHKASRALDEYSTSLKAKLSQWRPKEKPSANPYAYVNGLSAAAAGQLAQMIEKDSPHETLYNEKASSGLDELYNIGYVTRNPVEEAGVVFWDVFPGIREVLDGYVHLLREIAADGAVTEQRVAEIVEEKLEEQSQQDFLTNEEFLAEVIK